MSLVAGSRTAALPVPRLTPMTMAAHSPAPSAAAPPLAPNHQPSTSARHYQVKVERTTDVDGEHPAGGGAMSMDLGDHSMAPPSSAPLAGHPAADELQLAHTTPSTHFPPPHPATGGPNATAPANMNRSRVPLLAVTTAAAASAGSSLLSASYTPSVLEQHLASMAATPVLAPATTMPASGATLASVAAPSAHFPTMQQMESHPAIPLTGATMAMAPTRRFSLDPMMTMHTGHAIGGTTGGGAGAAGGGSTFTHPTFYPQTVSPILNPASMFNSPKMRTGSMQHPFMLQHDSPEPHSLTMAAFSLRQNTPPMSSRSLHNLQSLDTPMEATVVSMQTNTTPTQSFRHLRRPSVADSEASADSHEHGGKNLSVFAPTTQSVFTPSASSTAPNTPMRQFFPFTPTEKVILIPSPRMGSKLWQASYAVQQAKSQHMQDVEATTEGEGDHWEGEPATSEAISEEAMLKQADDLADKEQRKKERARRDKLRRQREKKKKEAERQKSDRKRPATAAELPDLNAATTLQSVSRAPGRRKSEPPRVFGEGDDSLAGAASRPSTGGSSGGTATTGSGTTKSSEAEGTEDDLPKDKTCELCERKHAGTYGGGRFCCAHCARHYSIVHRWDKKQSDR